MHTQFKISVTELALINEKNICEYTFYNNLEHYIA